MCEIMKRSLCESMLPSKRVCLERECRKRSLDIQFVSNKRQCFECESRKRSLEVPCGSNKRVCRSGDEALHRMLHDAHVRIAALEEELKHAKMLQKYYCCQMRNFSYNHDVLCY